MLSILAIASVPLFGAQQSMAQNLLVNSGYETTEDVVGWLPDDYGNWQGDVSAVITASQDDGIIPFEGVQMLDMIATHRDGPSIDTIGCEVWQLIDLSAYSAQIATGNASLHGEAWYNRVEGDAETDNQFNVAIYAFNGAIDNFDQAWLHQGYTAWSEGQVFTDGDTMTWEMAETDLLLPTSTSFVAFRVGATENVMNDADSPEFDGHYADAATVTLIPTPAAGAIMLSAFGLNLVRRRRREA